MKNEEKQLIVKIVNSFERDIKFRFEPWVDEYNLSEGQNIVIAIKGGNLGLLEIEYEENSIILYAGEDTVFDVVDYLEQ